MVMELEEVRGSGSDGRGSLALMCILPVEPNYVLALFLQHKSILPMNAIYRGRRRGSVYMITDLYETTVDELIHNKDVLTIVNSIMICNCRK